VTAHPSEDRLLDIAAGLVAKGAAADDLAHLYACPDCEQRFRSICRDLERSRLARPAPRRKAWIAAGLAAAAAIVAAILVPLARTPAVPDPATYWLPVDSETIELRTGRTDVERSAFAEAAGAYRDHDAARVVRLLSGKDIPESHDPLRLLYASALLKTGDARGSLRELAALKVETLPQPYRDRALWIKLGALRVLSRDDEARAIAREMSERPGEFEDGARRLSAR